MCCADASVICDGCRARKDDTTIGDSDRLIMRQLTERFPVATRWPEQDAALCAFLSANLRTPINIESFTLRALDMDLFELLIVMARETDTRTMRGVLGLVSVFQRMVPIDTILRIADAATRVPWRGAQALATALATGVLSLDPDCDEIDRRLQRLRLRFVQ